MVRREEINPDIPDLGSTTGYEEESDTMAAEPVIFDPCQHGVLDGRKALWLVLHRLVGHSYTRLFSNSCQLPHNCAPTASSTLRYWISVARHIHGNKSMASRVSPPGIHVQLPQLHSNSGRARQGPNEQQLDQLFSEERGAKRPQLGLRPRRANFGITWRSWHVYHAILERAGRRLRHAHTHTSIYKKDSCAWNFT